MVGDGVLREAAVELIAREAGALAEVLAAAQAVAALAARPAEPGHADALAGREGVNSVPGADHGSDDLVPGHEGQLRLSELAVDDVQVGTADAARVDADEHLATRDLGIRENACPQRAAGLVQDHRAHVGEEFA